jgi:hypothetical protein
MGFAYAKEQTPRQRTVSFLVAIPLPVYVTGLVSEITKMGPYTLAVAAIGSALLESDLIGGVLVVGRQWRADPFATFRPWWSLRGNSGPRSHYRDGPACPLKTGNRVRIPLSIPITPSTGFGDKIQ